MSDVEVVNLEDRAKTALSLGESHFREFKSVLHGQPTAKSPRTTKSVCRDIAEALVAFANADGGELLVGVEDDGTISGTEQYSDRDFDVFKHAPKTHVHNKTPLPSFRTASLILDDHRVLYFSIHKSTAHVHLTSDGRCLQRRDLETLPISTEDIRLGHHERVSREYDRQYVDGATAYDLREDLVKTVSEHISPGMSIEKCLQYLDLAEYLGPGLRLRKGALLLFAKEPHQWHPRLQLRIIKMEGTELRTGKEYNVTSDQTVSGNILDLVEKGWEALRPQLVQTRLGTDARFSSTVMYPELACREALVNAISHRDYSEEGRGIEVYIFDDRMEVKNPGCLLSSISLNDVIQLKGVHQSRNTVVARVLREVGYMRELGEGMRRMFLLMQQNELTPPEINNKQNSFGITLRHNTIYSSKEALWLENFQSFNLTREQKAIVVLGMGEQLVAPQDIWDRLGIVDTEHYRQLIRSLQELRILHSEIPKARAQLQARRRKIAVRNVPRFKISVPTRVGKTETSKPNPQREQLEVSSIDSPDEYARLWIGNVPRLVDYGKLLEHFRQFGEIQECYVPKMPDRKETKGYAFIEFESENVARMLVKKADAGRFLGHTLIVRRAFPKRKG